MIKVIGALCLLAACTTGDSPTDPTGRTCSATFTASGTFTPDPGATPPVDSTGCWPAGTWTFSLARVMNDCDPAPNVLPQYQFQGVQTLDMNGDPVVDTFMYLTDPSAKTIVKVSEGGAGLCEGELDIFSSDGKTVFALKPELNSDNTITGDGEFGIFSTNQWPY